MNWREATCEKCTFRVGDECRRFPQFKDVELFEEGVKYENGGAYFYHEVTGYQNACAEYAETIQPLTIKEATR